MAIQFDESRPARAYQNTQQIGAVTKAFIQLGLAKTAAGARVPMVVVMLLALALTAYILVKPTIGVSDITPEQQAALDLEFERETYGSQR